MKIIRPVKLDETNSTSDAPPDNVSDWEPVGRPLHKNVNALSLRHAGSHLYAAFDDGNVYKVLLSDGSEEIVLVASDHLNNAQEMIEAVPSPDEQYIALVHTSGSTSYHSSVKVIELSSNQEVFPASTGTDLRHALFDQGRARAFWSPDSSRFQAVIYADGGEDHVVKFARTSDWLYLGASSTAQATIDAAHADPAGISYYSDLDPVYKSDSSSFFIVAHTAETDHRIVLAEITKDRVRTQEKYLYTNSEEPYDLLHNVTRGELLLMGDQVRAFDDGTFSAKSLPVTFPKSNSFSISQDGAELTIRTASVQPYLRRFAAADYASAGDLDSILGAVGNFMNYGPDHYIVGMDAGGYALVSYPGGALIDQTNPDVTKGDVYRFEKRLYEVLVDTNDSPTEGITKDPPTWLDLGAINPLRMFDGKVGSYTQGQDSLEINITASVLLDGLALFGLSASSIRVQMFDGETVLYDSGDVSLRDSTAVDGWYNYFYLPRGVRSDFVLTSLPPFKGARLNIVLSAPGTDVRVGELVSGQVRRLGSLLFGSDFGTLDFSTKERDTFGNFEIVKRKSSKRGNYQVEVRTNQIAWIHELLEGLRTIPAVYIGSEQQRESIIYGFYIGFNTVIERPVYSQSNIEVEGLI